MTTLTRHDLQFALMRCPKALLAQMKQEVTPARIFVGGGFLRSVVAGDTVNDIDVFVSSKDEAKCLARKLAIRRLRLSVPEPGEASTEVALSPATTSCINGGLGKGPSKPRAYLAYAALSEDQRVQVDRSIYSTDNAYTLIGFSPAIQVIHRWVFDAGNMVAASFDFTCCAAVFWWDGDAWRSYCDERFYCDVAAERLVYRAPMRHEDAGGSLLRVLKYYQKGYRIPLDSLAMVISRLVAGVNLSVIKMDCRDGERHIDQKDFSFVILGLLREVDPAIDPSHIAHLPAEDANLSSLQQTQAHESDSPTAS